MNLILYSFFCEADFANGNWRLKIPLMEIYASIKTEDMEVYTLTSSISDTSEG